MVRKKIDWLRIDCPCHLLDIKNTFLKIIFLKTFKRCR